MSLMTCAGILGVWQLARVKAAAIANSDGVATVSTASQGLRKKDQLDLANVSFLENLYKDPSVISERRLSWQSSRRYSEPQKLLNPLRPLPPGREKLSRMARSSWNCAPKPEQFISSPPVGSAFVYNGRSVTSVCFLRSF
jgi:hypothetical protein